jgi:formylglycine-generating enzyme required for sulfatase activity
MLFVCSFAGLLVNIAERPITGESTMVSTRRAGLEQFRNYWNHRETALAAAFAIALVAAGAQDTKYTPKRQQLPPPDCLTKQGEWLGGYGPCDASTYQEWLNDVTHWRTERRIRIGYDDARYGMPQLLWTQSSFLQPQMMAQDRYFYDPVAGKYTVDRYLDDLEKRYGGIDAVLIWPTYPNMGIDDRNQHDMIRSMPGGIEGVRTMVGDFHRRGVRVLFPMMMWDQGTRDPGKPWPQAIAETMKAIDADGVNGDTQDGVPVAFSLASDHVGHSLAFEPEGGPADEALAWNVMTWGQYEFPFVPEVDRYKWLETRHMVNISDRWARNKTDDVQFAFFNGVGWESWENIWGIWNGITERDGEATRRMATLERGLAAFLISPGWQPYYPTHRYGVYASRWPLKEQTVWTIVNRNEYDVGGREMGVPAEEGVRYFDLYHGIEFTPDKEGDTAVLSFGIEAHGFAAVLATNAAPDAKLQDLMTRMKAMTAQPLSSYADQRKTLAQQIVAIAPVKVTGAAPAGMVAIPGGDYVFKVQGIEIEGFNDIGVDVQFPWEDMPRRFHEHRMTIPRFYMDTYPVTNAEFKRFLDATHYQPADTLNFLRDWKDGAYPQGWAKKPVTWVSLEDARAYAKWAGKRLPHEWEWQYAAQGGNPARIYPWGDAWDASAVPAPAKGRTLTQPDNVDAHAAGASAFGVMDMVGNVWQWTDEFVDEHTRAGILRGGSYYQPQGSIWYFPQAYRNDQHGKLLLMAPSYDRSGTVGFRCVSDAE